MLCTTISYQKKIQLSSTLAQVSIAHFKKSNFLSQKLPVGHQNLADALKGLTLNLLVAVCQHRHNDILATKLAHQRTSIGIKSSELSNIVQSNASNRLYKKKAEISVRFAYPCKLKEMFQPRQDSEPRQ